MKEQTPNAATAFAKMLYNPPVLYVADFVLRPLQMSDAGQGLFSQLSDTIQASIASCNLAVGPVQRYCCTLKMAL